MRNIILILSVCLIFSSPSFAQNLTFSYAPAANVKGGVDEGEIFHDDYREYDLDPGTAKSVEINFGKKSTWYVEYTALDTESSQGEIYKNKYSSLTAGVVSKVEKPINNTYDGYIKFNLGLGVSRFDLGSETYRGVGEIKMEAGAVLNKRIFFGPGIKFQLIGYPSETMAQTTIFYLGAGFKF